MTGFIRIHSDYKSGLILNGPQIDMDWKISSDYIGMKLFVSDTNSRMIRKIPDWNSFWASRKFSESFRNLYPHQTVSFRSNPKLVINPRLIQNPSELTIRMNPIESGQFELSIRMIPKTSVSFGLTGFIRINSNYSDWPDSYEFMRITSSDWFWMDLRLIRIEKFLRIISEWNCLLRIQIPEWFGKFRIEIHSEPIRIISEFVSASNSFIPI